MAMGAILVKISAVYKCHTPLSMYHLVTYIASIEDNDCSKLN